MSSSPDPAIIESRGKRGGEADDENGSGKRRKASITEEDSPSLAGSVDDDVRRRLRNEREQKRSAHISEQFDTLRDLMVQAGVIVPQGTRATILAAAKQYIDLLQEKERLANE
jgi:Helix-loop-helix DNA-binding domain